MNVKQTMMTALIIMEQGGLGPGGLNFDAKVSERDRALVLTMSWRGMIGDNR